MSSYLITASIGLPADSVDVTGNLFIPQYVWDGNTFHPELSWVEYPVTGAGGLSFTFGTPGTTEGYFGDIQIPYTVSNYNSTPSSVLVNVVYNGDASVTSIAYNPVP